MSQENHRVVIVGRVLVTTRWRASSANGVLVPVLALTSTATSPSQNSES